MESNEIVNVTFLEGFICEYEEESFVDLTQTLFNDIFKNIEKSLGGGEAMGGCFKKVTISLPMAIQINRFPKYDVSFKTPRYIIYCCLKIVC